MLDVLKKVVQSVMVPATGSLMNVAEQQVEADSKASHVKMLILWIVSQEQDAAVTSKKVVKAKVTGVEIDVRSSRTKIPR